jgi:glycerol-3-phosphate dehydrogenase (NAD(P)+)
MIGLAGTGDLVATALAPESRNRRAGELLADGVPADQISGRVGQAVEALQTVPMLARAIGSAGLAAPVTSALAGLIEGDLPLEEWVSIVRTTVPQPPTRRREPRRFLRRLRERIRDLFTGRSANRDRIFTGDETKAATLPSGNDRRERADAPDHRDR